jgi:hypothetical protein
MSSIEKKLSFWIQNNYNVLFKGKHGVGKTAMVTEAFDKAGLKWLYFSASTMDPWVDFIGVPKEVKDDQGRSYLDLIRPKQFQDDEVEALFFDEFNRSAKKVRNAVMELIQFKSINGRKFSKLKVIWAAINPDNDDQKYDVEELDPAQKDRFHVRVDIPYAPNAAYFKQRYGDALGEVALIWWKELDAKTKDDISPRRLDYALDIHVKGGDLRDVLPNNANINKLLVEIKNGSFTQNLKKMFEAQAVEEARTFLKLENNYAACADMIVKKPDYLKFFLPLLSDEKISSLMHQHRNVEEFMLNNVAGFEGLLKDVGNANLNKQLSRRVRDALAAYNVKKALASGFKQSDTLRRHFNAGATVQEFRENLPLAHGYTTQQRVRSYHILSDNMVEKMSLDDAKKVLTVLLGILGPSQKSTITSKFPNLIPMINHVIYILVSGNVKPHIQPHELQKLTEFPEFIYNVEYKLPNDTAKSA